jgi:predicted DNA-binding ribbon-helix-helix protein
MAGRSSLDAAAAASLICRVPTLRKRSINLAGHATSLALEPEFWEALTAMARVREVRLAALIAEIDAARGARPLASACRVAALAWAGGTRSDP